MTRMLDALKQIQARPSDEDPPTAATPRDGPSGVDQDGERRGDEHFDLHDDPTAVEAALPPPQPKPESLPGATTADGADVSTAVQPPGPPATTRDDQEAGAGSLPTSSWEGIAASPELPSPSGSVVTVDAEPEAYGELRDRILAQLPLGVSSAVALASTETGEGMSELLLGLAANWAARGEDDVLAVDANFRRPSLGNRLGLETEPGLADLLLDHDRGAEVIHRTSVPRLSVLACGRLAASEWESGIDVNLAPLLVRLKQRFRFILIEAGGGCYSEVCLIARCCDAAYLTVNMGRTDRDDVLNAAYGLHQAGGRLLGCIVTGV